MNFILNKPYKVIWYSIPFLLLLSAVKLSQALDFQFHDTYVVISLLHIGIFLAIILLILGLIYWLMRRRKLVSWLTVLHLVGTIIPFFTVIFLGLYYDRTLIGGHQMYNSFHANFVIIAFLIGVVSQLFFFINIIFVLFRKVD